MSLLSILICTMPSRASMLKTLTDNILAQIEALPESMQRQVEILIDDNMSITTGTKRNELLKHAKGDYVTAIDDDDVVSIDYVRLILQACLHNTDAVGIAGTITTNGTREKKWFISKDYDRWFEKDNIYYRTTNHISPVRRSIALQAMFPDVTIGEDAEYSRRLQPLIKTEVKISVPIYNYRYTCDEPKKLSPAERLRLSRMKNLRR